MGKLSPGNCPYCDAEAHRNSSWGFSPEGWADIKRKHDKGHPEYISQESEIKKLGERIEILENLAGETYRKFVKEMEEPTPQKECEQIFNRVDFGKLDNHLKIGEISSRYGLCVKHGKVKMNGNNCPKCNPQPEPKTNWEEKAEHTAEHIGIISKGCLETLIRETKSQLLSDIEKWVKENKLDGGYDYEQGYSEALEDLIEFLDSLK